MPATAALVTLVAAAWSAPVDGPVTRAFDLGRDPFEAGRHRGVDFAAPPGAPVRAACAGRVVVAGEVGASGRVVTLLCGRWRVTHMPLATVAVRRDANVPAGTRIGTTTSSAHSGLHFGVRRAATRFGYVDPLRFLRSTPPVPPTPVIARPRTPIGARPRTPLGPAPRGAPAPRRRPLAGRRRSEAPRAVTAPGGSGAADQSEAPRAVVAPRDRSSSRGLAPWPAWAGLALVLAGAGVRLRGWVGSRRVRTRPVAAVRR